MLADVTVSKLLFPRPNLLSVRMTVYKLRDVVDCNDSSHSLAGTLHEPGDADSARASVDAHV
jgi:hypothetical protein